MPNGSSDHSPVAFILPEISADRSGGRKKMSKDAFRSLGHRKEVGECIEELPDG